MTRNTASIHSIESPKPQNISDHDSSPAGRRSSVSPHHSSNAEELKLSRDPSTKKKPVIIEKIKIPPPKHTERGAETKDSRLLRLESVDDLPVPPSLARNKNSSSGLFKSMQQTPMKQGSVMDSNRYPPHKISTKAKSKFDYYLAPKGS